MSARAFENLPNERVDLIDAAAVPPVGIVEQGFDWLETEDWKDRRTRAALADGDAGRVIDNDLVIAWWRSLSTDAPLPRPQPLING